MQNLSEMATILSNEKKPEDVNHESHETDKGRKDSKIKRITGPSAPKMMP